MSTITSIADAVTDRLNAGSFSQSFTAERHYQPQFDLAELETLKVSVVPRSLTVSGSSRRQSQYDALVDIGVQKRLSADGDEKAQVDALLDLVEEIADHLRFERLPGLPEAVWVGLAHEPVVAAEHLEQHRQFTSLLTATYRVLR